MTNIDDVTTTKWVLRPKIDTKLAKNTLNVLQNANLCIFYNFRWKKFQILQNLPKMAAHVTSSFKNADVSKFHCS